MTVTGDHLKPLRLFDLSLVGSNHSTVILTRPEQEHLHGCPECQGYVEIIARDFSPENISMKKPGNA